MTLRMLQHGPFPEITNPTGATTTPTGITLLNNDISGLDLHSTNTGKLLQTNLHTQVSTSLTAITDLIPTDVRSAWTSACETVSTSFREKGFSKQHKHRQNQTPASNSPLSLSKYISLTASPIPSTPVSPIEFVLPLEAAMNVFESEEMMDARIVVIDEAELLSNGCDGLSSPDKRVVKAIEILNTRTDHNQNIADGKSVGISNTSFSPFTNSLSPPKSSNMGEGGSFAILVPPAGIGYSLSSSSSTHYEGSNNAKYSSPSGLINTSYTRTRNSPNTNNSTDSVPRLVELSASPTLSGTKRLRSSATIANTSMISPQSTPSPPDSLQSLSSSKPYIQIPSGAKTKNLSQISATSVPTSNAASMSATSLATPTFVHAPAFRLVPNRSKSEKNLDDEEMKSSNYRTSGRIQNNDAVTIAFRNKYALGLVSNPNKAADPSTGYQLPFLIISKLLNLSSESIMDPNSASAMATKASLSRIRDRGIRSRITSAWSEWLSLGRPLPFWVEDDILRPWLHWEPPTKIVSTSSTLNEDGTTSIQEPVSDYDNYIPKFALNLRFITERSYVEGYSILKAWYAAGHDVPLSNANIAATLAALHGRPPKEPMIHPAVHPTPADLRRRDLGSSIQAAQGRIRDDFIYEVSPGSLSKSRESLSNIIPTSVIYSSNSLNRKKPQEASINIFQEKYEKQNEKKVVKLKEVKPKQVKQEKLISSSKTKSILSSKVDDIPNQNTSTKNNNALAKVLPRKTETVPILENTTRVKAPVVRPRPWVYEFREKDGTWSFGPNTSTITDLRYWPKAIHTAPSALGNTSDGNPIDAIMHRDVAIEAGKRCISTFSGAQTALLYSALSGGTVQDKKLSNAQPSIPQNLVTGAYQYATASPVPHWPFVGRGGVYWDGSPMIVRIKEPTSESNIHMQKQLRRTRFSADHLPSAKISNNESDSVAEANATNSGGKASAKSRIREASVIETYLDTLPQPPFLMAIKKYLDSPNDEKFSKDEHEENNRLHNPQQKQIDEFVTSPSSPPVEKKSSSQGLLNNLFAAFVSSSPTQTSLNVK
jgi:hypothetical protein